MKMQAKTTLATLSLALMATTAHAGGLDRTTYTPHILFEQGKVYIEGSFARVYPDVDGDLNVGPINGVDDISPNYGLMSAGIKMDVTDRVAVAFQTFEAVGSDIDYSGAGNFYVPLTASLSGRAYTGTVKVDITDNISLFGGFKHIVAGGDATAITPSLSAGADVWDFDTGHGTGYIAGIAYSIPDIALRVSLTYESAFDIDLDTTVTGNALGPTSGTTTATIPEAWELYFQTGIAPGTLLFGSVRHTSWSGANIQLMNTSQPGVGNPDAFALTDFSDSLTWKLGVGKQLTDRLSMSVSGTYEDGSGKPSTLQPVDGKVTLGLGAKYKLTENIELSAGVSHTWLGDNETDTGQAVEAQFEDNHAWAFGTKIALRF